MSTFLVQYQHKPGEDAKGWATKRVRYDIESSIYRYFRYDIQSYYEYSTHFVDASVFHFVPPGSAFPCQRKRVKIRRWALQVGMGIHVVPVPVVGVFSGSSNSRRKRRAFFDLIQETATQEYKKTTVTNCCLWFQVFVPVLHVWLSPTRYHETSGQKSMVKYRGIYY